MLKEDFSTSEILDSPHYFAIALDGGEEYTLIDTKSVTSELYYYGAYRFNQVCNGKTSPFEKYSENFIERVTEKNLSAETSLSERLLEVLYESLILTGVQTYTQSHFQGNQYFDSCPESDILRKKILQYQSDLLSRQYENLEDCEEPYLIYKNNRLETVIPDKLDPYYYFPQQNYQLYFDAKLKTHA